MTQGIDTPIWEPRYTITSVIANGLMAIEAARAVVDHTPLPLAVQAEIRYRARLRSTHYSTRIEGNRLTLAEAERAIVGKNKEIHERERDVAEVRNYWHALLRVEEWSLTETPLSEDLIRRLHALVEKGTRAKPTPYRDGQNVIRDAVSGQIVYLPPEAKDVPCLMSAMIAWTHQAGRKGLPVPIIAALLHYQFVTIHPFYDGNGRTARLLATFALYRGGYDLNGFYSLEERHAQYLPLYYKALAIHPHHNYYAGRADADLTSWIGYFIQTLSHVFTISKAETLRLSSVGSRIMPKVLRRLEPRAKTVIALFARQEKISSHDVAHALGLSQRMARELLCAWVSDGWLEIANPSNRGRAYRLAANYRQFIGNHIP